MKNKNGLNQFENYLQILNHPRIYELTRVVDLSIQAGASKERAPIDSSEITQISLAVLA
jgi:hypothetical protein